MSNKLKKATVYLFGIRFLGSIISFFSLPITVKYFGISVERDIWLIVSVFTTSLSSAVFAPINETLRTRFIFIRETYGADEALKRIQSLLIFFLLIGLFFGFLSVLFASQIKSFLAPSITSENDFKIFLYLLLSTLPCFIINQLIVTFVAILNTYEIYYIPEFIGCISGIINIICIILFASSIGIYSLVISQYISIIIYLSILFFFMTRKNIRIFNIHNNFKIAYIKDFLIFSLPFFVLNISQLFNSITEKKLMNRIGTGVVSTIDYASKFPSVVQTVVFSVLISVVLPSLSSYFLMKKYDDFWHSFKNSIQIISGITIIFVSFLCGAAEPLCRFFFLRGNIDEQTVNIIINLLRLYSFAIIFASLYWLLGYSLLSQQNGIKYAIIGTITQITVIILNIIFYKTFLIYTFVLSFYFAHLLSIIVMSIILLGKNIFFITDIFKSIFLSFLISFVLYILNSNFALKSDFFQLLLNGFLLCFLSAICLRFIGINVIEIVKKYLKNHGFGKELV